MTSLNNAYRSLLGRFVLPKNSLADQLWPRVKAGVLAASVLAAFGAAEASAADPVDHRDKGSDQDSGDDITSAAPHERRGR